MQSFLYRAVFEEGIIGIGARGLVLLKQRPLYFFRENSILLFGLFDIILSLILFLGGIYICLKVVR